MRHNLGLFKEPISFIDLPVVAVPVWPEPSLPNGVQFIAAPGQEAKAVCAAHRLDLKGFCRGKVAA